MRKVFFRIVAAGAIFLLSATNSVHGQLVRPVSIGGAPMAQFYVDPSFWMQTSAPIVKKQTTFRQAMNLIDDFEHHQYDLYLAWLEGAQNDKRIILLENELFRLYGSLDETSASVEGDPLLQKKIQD